MLIHELEFNGSYKNVCVYIFVCVKDRTVTHSIRLPPCVKAGRVTHSIFLPPTDKNSHYDRGKLLLNIPGLPDKHGRLQILNIHTAKLRESSMLDSDISMDDLAARTKNFSGAEIEGLVRSATSTAMNKLITV